jgi:membrane protease subunit (stomatin/prohibitin family)
MAISDIIKYEGDNTTFIWKHPTEDFNTTTQLIVHESQEAIFFANGQALDLFGAGRHTLETSNIPLIRNAFNLVTGGQMPFHCEVYFINKVEQLAIKWGTNSKVQYLDPVYGFPLSIGASGEMSLRGDDSRKLLVKVVGTETVLTREHISEYFRMFLNARIKSYIAQEMKAKSISIFEVDARLVEFSDDVQTMLTQDFSDYGVALEKFFVTTIAKPDGDLQYEQFKELHFRQYADVKDAQIRQNVGMIEQETEAKKTVIEASATAQKRQIEGYDYRTERSYDVAEKVAQNEGVGEFASAGIGLGMMGGVGLGFGAAVANTTKGAMGPIIAGGNPMASPPTGSGNPPSPVDIESSPPGAAAVPPVNTSPDAPDVVQVCMNCGERLSSGAVFCMKCGSKVKIPQVTYCANCGAETPPGGNFCIKCGTPVGQAPSGQSDTGREKEEE